MDKKAQVRINIGLISILVIGLILVLFFIFSSTFRFIVIGSGLLILSAIIIMGKSIENQKTKVILFIVLLGTGLILIFASGVLQSTLSIDQVTVGADGKVYWLLTATADSIDEGYAFNYNPGTYTKSDGTKIDPQDSLRISFSKKDSYCKYTLQQETYKTGTYKILSNPDRVANIYIQDSNSGDVLTMDGTIVQTKTLSDGLTIKTQGIIAGKNDCPNYENVAILGDGEIVNKDDLKNLIDNYCPWWNPFCLIGNLFGSGIEVNENTQFISAFKTPPIITTNEVRGNINIGNAIFTLTASQDYFNSVVIYPPKDVKPNIDSIDMPSEIKQEATSSVKVIISNKEDSEGTISVKATSNDLSISNSIQNVNLKEKVTVNFLVTASDNDGSSSIEIEACGTNQFGTSTCDTNSKSFTITKVQPPEYCGDGICQSSESYNTCSADCEKETDCEKDSDCKSGYKCVDNLCKIEEKTCAWYEEPYTKITKDYGFAYWRFFVPFVKPIETPVSGCKTSGWVTWTFISVIVISLGAYAISVSTNKKRKRR